MTAGYRGALTRLYDLLDHGVEYPSGYLMGSLKTRVSGGSFGPMPWILGPMDLRIRGDAVIGAHFKSRSETWKARLCVGRGATFRAGHDFYINGGASVEAWHEVIIGSNVMVAPFCSILDDDCHWVEPGSARHRGPIVIGDNVWLTRNVTVLPGVTIGSGSVIGANSVVSRDIPANVFAAGTPARVIREIEVPDGWTHCYGFQDYRPSLKRTALNS